MIWVEAGFWKNNIGSPASVSRGLPAGVSSAMRVLKDWNAWKVEAPFGPFSGPRKRYRMGYEFARRNLYKIRQHMLLSGNHLQIVASGRGAAFAEGMAACLYEERGIKTHLMVVMEGLRTLRLPQQPDAVGMRIHFRHGEPVPKGHFEQRYFADMYVGEQNLDSGFCRYSYCAGRVQLQVALGNIYLRGKVLFLQRHKPNQVRPFNTWTAIAHAIRLLEEGKEKTSPPLLMAPDKTALGQFHLYQN